VQFLSFSLSSISEKSNDPISLKRGSGFTRWFSPSVRSFVCLSVAKIRTENAISKNPLLGSLKFTMAD